MGFAYTLSSQFIKNGGVVYGVCYSEKNIKKHRIYKMRKLLNNYYQPEDSKYVQSRKYDIYKWVEKRS